MVGPLQGVAEEIVGVVPAPPRDSGEDGALKRSQSKKLREIEVGRVPGAEELRNPRKVFRNRKNRSMKCTVW